MHVIQTGRKQEELKTHLVLGSNVLANILCRHRVATSSEVRTRGRDAVACRRALEVDYDAAFCPGGRPCDDVICVIAREFVPDIGGA